ncbi:hypothetical protein BCR34DRAFT_634375 [Clohesyomyces aquaticus]|uniref:Uncharacterized protein n=1 Tax=Clohesyomyces aquaticus TaxID=1231657 RepID=A0A1Y2A3H6_9PLEO|nr:hypothetical protein BCR34DRAFT_634375 [Clohesyomyces aquaticus]
MATSNSNSTRGVKDGGLKSRPKVSDPVKQQWKFGQKPIARRPVKVLIDLAKDQNDEENAGPRATCPSQTKPSISKTLPPRSGIKPSALRGVQGSRVAKTQNGKNLHRPQVPSKLSLPIGQGFPRSAYYPTQHTQNVAAWQHHFADSLQAALTNRETIHRAHKYNKEDLKAAGALLALGRPVGRTAVPWDERVARPDLWSKHTISEGVDWMIETLGK